MAVLQSKAQGGSRIAPQQTPPKGRYIATCIEIWDQFGVLRNKHKSDELEKVDLTVFYFAFKDKQGIPYVVSTNEMYPMKISSHEKSNLMKFLSQWIGESPKLGWDYCNLKGAGAEIRVSYVESTKVAGKVFPIIQSVAPVEADDIEKIIPLEYFEKLELLGPPTAKAAAIASEDDDDLPF